MTDDNDDSDDYDDNDDSDDNAHDKDSCINSNHSEHREINIHIIQDTMVIITNMIYSL